MVAVTVLEAPVRQQFEPPFRGTCADDTDWRGWNCGPTDAAFIDGYYHDRWLDIDYVRRLAVGECTATRAVDVEAMLDALGIPSDHHYGTTVSLIKQIVAGRNRPVAVAVNMALIPDVYTQDPFNGNHWLVVGAATRFADGTPATVSLDSNSPGHPWCTIPDWALERALLGDAVYPQKAKAIASGQLWTARFQAFALGPRTGLIMPHHSVRLWTPAHPGSPADTFTNGLDRATHSQYDGYITYAWPKLGPDIARWPTPKGTFLHGLDGAPKGYGVLKQEVVAADGKPW